MKAIEHGGLPPLINKEAASRIMLVTLGRLQAGKDVPRRLKAIAKALELVGAEDRYWPEALVSGLTEEELIEAAPAHMAALAVALELYLAETSQILGEVNNEMTEERFAVVDGFLRASPDFKKRFMDRTLDSDQLFLRCAMVHFFRRDPQSIVQMFTIDSSVRLLNRAIKQTVNGLTKTILSEKKKTDVVPADAWGYIVVLLEMKSRAGLFMPAPDDFRRRHVADMRKRMEAELGVKMDDVEYARSMLNSCFAAFYEGQSYQLFSILGPVALEMLGLRCIGLFGRRADGNDGSKGYSTSIIEIPTTDPAEARRLVDVMPAFTMHDQMREFGDYLQDAQMRKDLEH